MQENTNRNSRLALKISMLALFSSTAYVVMALSKLIPINILGFLSFDLKDVVIGFCGFIYGPLSAVIVSVVVSLIEMLTVSGTGPWGFVMNVLSTCFFICPAALIYRRNRDISGAVIGLVIGAFMTTSAMLLWNYLIVPLYTTEISREAVLPLLVPIFLPFNLIKSGINSTLMLLLYKPVVNALRTAHLIEESPQGSSQMPRSRKIILIVISAVALVAFVFMALSLAGII